MTPVTRSTDWRRWISALGPVMGLVLVWTLFAALTGERFVAWENQRLMLMQTAVVGTAAIGATLIIIAGGIDLSVGSTIALSTMLTALALREGLPPASALMIGVLTGACSGGFIGMLVVGRLGLGVAISVGLITAAVCQARWGWGAGAGLGAVVTLVLSALLPRVLPRLALSPFIVTLGMWGALRGIAKGLGDNQPVYAEPTWLLRLMQSGSEWWNALLPPGVWVMLALAVLAWALLRYTVFGRHVVAVGSNELTARLCGVPVERVRWMVYVIGVACAGLAGVFQFSFLTMGDPTTAQGYELRIIAAVVIGGASLSGGQGSVAGTLIGALLMTVIDRGCTALGMENWIQEILTGAIILAAVLLDRWRHGSRE